jgi:hypothetical protein
MTFELDHLFICTDIGAPQADRLISFGLTEGTSRVHSGQGTTNRCFFFHNFMLELLWVHNPEEAQSEITRPTHLWERWSDRTKGSCPFGFCLRPTSNLSDALPFPTWEYYPAYRSDSFNISVATNATVLTEPMLFYLPFAKRQDSYPGDWGKMLNHQAGFKEVTRATFISPYANDLSPEMQGMIDSNLLELQQGETYLVELGFDGEQQGKHADFRPELPLILSW